MLKCLITTIFKFTFKMDNCPKIIIDCDAGTDDALALMLLIAGHKMGRIDIKAITCVMGNTDVDNVVANVFRTLEACSATYIPVYKGAYSPLLCTESSKEALDNTYHGVDGFGDVFADKPNIDRLRTEHAVEALHRITSENKGEVSLVCLGPLTNIALAIKMYPNFVDSVKKFFVMGGNCNAVGNITPQAEFNFYTDPESVHIVLGQSDNKLWLLPWETCQKSQITWEWRNEVFGSIDTQAVHLMNAIEKKITELKVDKKAVYYIPCDAILAGIVLRPDMATDIATYHIDIELSGRRTRGQVVLDHLMSNEPNAYLIKEFDSLIFEELLLFSADPQKYNFEIFP